MEIVALGSIGPLTTIAMSRLGSIAATATRVLKAACNCDFDCNSQLEILSSSGDYAAAHVSIARSDH